MSEIADENDSTLRVFAPIPGFFPGEPRSDDEFLGGAPFDVASDIEIGLLTDDERKIASDEGVLEPLPAQADERHSHVCIRLAPTSVPPDGPTITAEVIWAIDAVLTAISLETRRWIEVRSIFAYSGRTGSIDVRPMVREDVEVFGLSAQQRLRVSALTERLRNPRVQADRSLYVALPRFRRALRRREVADAVLDLAIAAEAIFLRGIRDELRFRLSLRAANFLGETLDRKRWISSVLKDLYDHRSAVAHGEWRDNPGDLGELAECHEEAAKILAEGLVKYVEMTASGQSLDVNFWTDLEFSGGGPD